MNASGLVRGCGNFAAREKQLGSQRRTRPCLRCSCTVTHSLRYFTGPADLAETVFLRSFMMSVSQTLETEEYLPSCLHLRLHHPLQSSKGQFSQLPVGRRVPHSADDALRLGRDSQSCSYALLDPRVSRKQLALQAYRRPESPDLLFSIQNLSQRGRMSVNGRLLGYLERLDLPDKALVRFGEYELLVSREPGEAQASFEVEFEVLAVPPSRETSSGVPTMTPVSETGHPTALMSAGPLEVDESLICYS